MTTDDWTDERLRQLQTSGQYRHCRVLNGTGGKIHTEHGRTYLNFSSNDYLNLANDERVVGAASDKLHKFGCGATASRLVTGTLPLHEELETELAAHKGYENAMVFGSGFLTNAGVIPAIAGRQDKIFADKLVHASILDGIRLSRARLHRFAHNDVDHLENLLSRHTTPQARPVVITESVFSMDGDLAPLPEIASVTKKHHGTLMVDEAHAVGVFGPDNAGLVADHRLQDDVDIAMGTLSKALGGYGGYIACSNRLKAYILNVARSFIYTTALPPACLGSALGALKVLQNEPHIGEELRNKAAFFRNRLAEHELDTRSSDSQIIPVIIGSNEKTMNISEALKKDGILAIPIRPPTVPENTARLRLSVTRAHTYDDLSWAAERIAERILRG